VIVTSKTLAYCDTYLNTTIIGFIVQASGWNHRGRMERVCGSPSWKGQHFLLPFESHKNQLLWGLAFYINLFITVVESRAAHFLNDMSVPSRLIPSN